MLKPARVLLTLAAVGLLMGVAAPASALPADTSDFEFQLFDADYTIGKAADGTSTLAVVEHIVAVFPNYDQNRGIIRAIPNYYQQVDLETTVQSVVDENGDAVPFEQTDGNEFTELALGTDDYVYGATTYVISYTQQNAVGTFADTGDDEFYWDVNGTGWEQPFERVAATVHVPSDLTPALTGDSACYQGPSKSSDPCPDLTSVVTADGGTDFTASASNLNPGGNLSVAIGFTAGTFVQGEKSANAPQAFFGEQTPLWSVILTVLLSLAAAAVSAFAIRFKLTKGRGARGRGTIIPQYSVPKGLNVMVAANLVDRPTTAIPAQLVSLAVRKNLRILDYPVTPSGAEYTLQFLTTDGVDPLEHELLTTLFGPNPAPGTVRELIPDDVTLGSTVNAIAAKGAAAVTSGGYRGTASAAGCLFPILAVLVIGAGVLVQITTFGAAAFTFWPTLVIVLGIIALIISIATIVGKGPLTPLGAETRDYLLGMQLYLTVAEQERFRMLQSPDGAERIDVGDTKQIIKLYEKLLPFAVIWGVEDQWMRELEVRVATVGETPDWFLSNQGFSSIAFTHALRGVTTTATYTPPPPPSTYSGSSFGSSFGGSGGGGFSGGGGGGGGGGGR